LDAGAAAAHGRRELSPIAVLARGLRGLAALVVVALFALIVAVFAYAITSRYAFARPVIWADEVLVLAMVWCTFITGALLIEEREQVVFDLVYDRCPVALRRIVLLSGAVLLVGLLLAALPAIIDYTLFLWRERTSVLELRLDVAYACFALFIAAVIVRRLVLVARLLGNGWRDALAELEPPRAADDAR
jgi:TRAP-type C4-dicarboxylate transport system permease small subunit